MLLTMKLSIFDTLWKFVQHYPQPRLSHKSISYWLNCREINAAKGGNPFVFNGFCFMAVPHLIFHNIRWYCYHWKESVILWYSRHSCVMTCLQKRHNVVKCAYKQVLWKIKLPLLFGNGSGRNHRMWICEKSVICKLCQKPEPRRAEMWTEFVPQP